MAPYKLMAFGLTSTPVSGNPAAVLLNYDGDKRALAEQLALPVMVFVKQGLEAEPLLEFHYPQRVSPLCLHGALAAGQVLMQQAQAKTLVARTDGGLFLRLRQMDGLYQVQVQSQPPPTWTIDRAKVAVLLQCSPQAIGTADFHARAFNPLSGTREDAATGVAAAALAASLQRSIVIEQGYCLACPSEIWMEYDSPQAIWVGGRVRLVEGS